MAQCSSRCWMWLKSRFTASRRRRPQASRTGKSARSRLPSLCVNRTEAVQNRRLRLVKSGSRNTVLGACRFPFPPCFFAISRGPPRPQTDDDPGSKDEWRVIREQQSGSFPHFCSVLTGVDASFYGNGQSEARYNRPDQRVRRKRGRVRYEKMHEEHDMNRYTISAVVFAIAVLGTGSADAKANQSRERGR